MGFHAWNILIITLIETIIVSNVVSQTNSSSVADQLTRLSREDEPPITPMQVQKLAYFCHAWSLGLGFGPLFRDAVESCQQGPVIRSVSHALKPYGGDPIIEPLSESAASFSRTEEKIIAAVWNRHGVIDGLAL